jgi:DNA-binding response OmpR family regulator
MQPADNASQRDASQRDASQRDASPNLPQRGADVSRKLPEHDAARLCILVVDDDADTARLMSRLLQKRGYVVKSAASIRSAVEQMELGPVDLLISDITLSDGSGLDLMRQLGAGRSLSGIAISGHGEDADVAASLAAGFARHMVKPVDFDELLVEVEARAERVGLA